MFKQSYECKTYLNCIVSHQHRSCYSKFRCWVGPLRIECGRYEGLNVEDRVCLKCTINVDEKHVLIECPAYEDLKVHIFQNYFLSDSYFNSFNDFGKLTFILNCDND